MEKYRPKDMSELVGNNSVIANLKQWLQNWCAQQLAPASLLCHTEAGQKGFSQPQAAEEAWWLCLMCHY